MAALKILLASSEVAPFAKTGGLADVSAALGRYLGLAGHDVRVFLPLYKRIAQSKVPLTPVPELQDLSIQIGGRKLWYSIWTTPLAKPGSENEAKAWLIRCPELFDRDGIYTQDADEHVRFAMLNRGAIEACQHMRWAPDVFHCNDWHTALIPLYLRTVYAWDKLFERSRTLLTIHNIGYQGVFGTDVLGDLNLENERRFLYQDDLNEGRVNFLKTGVLYATALSTVSKTYAHEIQGDELGMGLQGLLKQRDDHFFGIVNGIDPDEWNPTSDALIPHHFSAKDPGGKSEMKAALLAKCGLPPLARGSRVPTLGIVSRLTTQKGFELAHDALTVFLHRDDLRLVVLGSGEERYEHYFDWLAGQFPQKVAYKKGYDNELAHWIEAGCDMFLMPSRYEPCGLNQMYSLAYGTIPIVRKTGGLADTVQDWNPAKKEGTGFVFDAFDAQAFFEAVSRASTTYRDEAAWKQLMANAMAQDFSWPRQIERYVELYRKLPQL